MKLRLVLSLAVCFLGVAACARQTRGVARVAAASRDELPVLRLSAAKATDPALAAALDAGDAAEVEKLLKQGISAANRDADGLTPLGHAIVTGRRDLVGLLLAAGADPNAAVGGDQPALFATATIGNVELATDLIRAGARLDFCVPPVGSALAAAVVGQKEPMIAALVEAGTPLELANEDGLRAIHYATWSGDEKTTRLLMSKGADIHCPSILGGTPLRGAASQGHAAIVRLLLEAGADPSPVDAFDRKPIDDAKHGGHDAVVRLLEAAVRPPAAANRACSRSAIAELLPQRNDATLRVLLHARENSLVLRDSAATSLEAPTLVESIRSVLGPSFTVSFPLDQSPDPRLPIRPVELVLWTYSSGGELASEASPALPAPPRPVFEEVARVAEYPWLLPLSSAAAERAARKLQADQMTQVLAVMVHPPATPDHFEAWDWDFRVQVAAALVASHLGSDPWAQSARRRALEDILDGPADWSNTAAVIALLDVARRDEVARPVVVETLLRVARRRSTPPAFQHAIAPAALALLEIPGIGPELVRELDAVLAER